MFQRQIIIPSSEFLFFFSRLYLNYYLTNDSDVLCNKNSQVSRYSQGIDL